MYGQGLFRPFYVVSAYSIHGHANNFDICVTYNYV